MGNCGDICSNNISKYKGDIIMDRLISEKSPSKRTDNYNIEKIQYLQRKIKSFLKRKKARKLVPFKTKQSTITKGGIVNSQKERKKNDDSKCQNNKNENNGISDSKKNSNKNNDKGSITNKIESLNNISNDNNVNYVNNTSNVKSIQHNSNSKIRNLFDNNDKTEEIEIYKKYTDEPSEENGLQIPTIKPDLLDNQIFKNDAFRSGIRKTNYENDPRDALNDNVRRKYPIIVEDQSSYLGEWKNGKRDGIGLLCWGKESKFLGHFVEDKVIGYGKLWHEEGDYYKGEWKDFQAQGWGIYYTKKGAYFRGEWKEDKQNGFGVEKWPRGSIFFGGYIKGNKNGIGVLNFESKAWYEGEFRNGIISGIGTFVFEDGRRYEGMWKNNKMDGYGMIIWPDENQFEGEFKEDRKEGFGVCKIGQKIFMGIWKDNKLEGNVIIIEDGKYKKQLWINGKASKSLPSDTFIFFEKYIDKYLKRSKKNKSIKSLESV
jgi:hypothetical protein